MRSRPRRESGCLRGATRATGTPRPVDDVPVVPLAALICSRVECELSACGDTYFHKEFAIAILAPTRHVVAATKDVAERQRDMEKNIELAMEVTMNEELILIEELEVDESVTITCGDYNL